MEKLEFFIEGSGMELPPLVRDSEGYLRGGFIGIGGNGIAIAPNGSDGCYNSICTNSGCINNDCTNIICVNTPCDNGGCYNKGTTTSTTVTAKVGATGLLI